MTDQSTTWCNDTMEGNGTDPHRTAPDRKTPFQRETAPVDRTYERREDLVSFMDSLFAAAVAFGISRLYVELDKALATSPWWVTALSFIPALTALAFVFDDWRQARWLILDYGYRVRLESNLHRFWIDCALAVVSFYMVVYAFLHPVAYMILVAIHLLLGYWWAILLRREIRGFLTAHLVADYPANSIGLTTAYAADNIDRFDLPNLDYRIGFAIRTHGIAAALILIAAITNAGFLLMSAGADPVEAVLRREAQVVAIWLPLAGLMVLKYIDSCLKKDWLRRCGYPRGGH